MLRALLSTRLSRPTSAIVIAASLLACVLLTVHAVRPSAAYRRALAELRQAPVEIEVGSTAALARSKITTSSASAVPSH